MKRQTLVTLLAIVPVCHQALAQAAETSRPMLEEVVVTATKRVSNLQDVSVAVTALSADLLRNAQITQTEDLVALVPSLNMQKGNSSGDSSFNIRGIGTQVFGIGVEPSVSTMIDGVSGDTYFENSAVLLGEVSALLETGANDVMEVVPCEGSIDKRHRLLPFVLDIHVKSVDLQSNVITVDWDPEF